MIRAFRPQDLNPLMSLWLESTTLAHPFISADYWRESAALVRDIYLPGHKPGYIKTGSGWRVLSACWKAVLSAPYSCGGMTGAALIQYAQQQFSLLSLEVYQQNGRACAFYRKHGFVVVAENFNRETRATTLIMQWASR